MVVIVSSVNWFSPTRQGAIGITLVRWLLEAGSVTDFSTSSTRAEMIICGKFVEVAAVPYVVFGRTVPA